MAAEERVSVLGGRGREGEKGVSMRKRGATVMTSGSGGDGHRCLAAEETVIDVDRDDNSLC